jgi:outer membrane protein assembly factor BamB
MVERDRPEGRGPRRFSGLVLAIGAVVVLAGCSGRTTGATNITGASAQLNAIGSCDQSCTAFMRWRVVGTSAWTNAPSFNVGKVSNVPWSQTATGLSAGASYEYQACGKEASWSDSVCVGPDDSPNTTQKFVAAAGSTDWPQFHYDPTLSGYNPFEITLDASNVSGLTQAWVSHVPSTHARVGSLAVANGMVYVGVFRGFVPSSLEALPTFCGTGGASCNPLWQATIPSVDVAPAVAGGVVYVAGDKLYAFSATGCGSNTCGPGWTGTTAGNILSSPTVVGGTVYLGSGAGDDKLYAFSASGCGRATCSPLWTAPTFGYINSAPAVSGGVIYVGTSDHHLYAFRATDGTLLWTGSMGGPIVSSPVVGAVRDLGDVVFVGSTDGHLYAFSAAGCGSSSCLPLWTAPTFGALDSTPAKAGDVVYVGSEDHNLYAFKVENGTLLWTGATGGALRSAPAVANGVVYVASTDGKLYEFPAGGCGSSTCSPLATQTPGNGIDANSSPAVASGAVYFGALGGNPGFSDGASLQAYSLP